MAKLLVFVVWLLGMAAIGLLCGHRPAAQVDAPVASVSAALPAASAVADAALPSSAAASAAGTAPPAGAVAASAPPAAVAATTAAATGARIEGLLKTRVIEFRAGSATLTATGLASLAPIAAALKGSPGVKVEVQGHTDTSGTEPTNRALSQARADAVKAALARQGVAPARITAKGYGSSQPVADNNTAEGRARNRRIAFSVEENK